MEFMASFHKIYIYKLFYRESAPQNKILKKIKHIDCRGFFLKFFFIVFIIEFNEEMARNGLKENMLLKGLMGWIEFKSTSHDKETKNFFFHVEIFGYNHFSVADLFSPVLSTALSVRDILRVTRSAISLCPLSFERRDVLSPGL